MDDHEIYYKKIEESEMLLLHYQNCIEDVSGEHPEKNLRINKDDLKDVEQKYRSVLDTLHSSNDPQEAMPHLIRACTMMRSKLEEWHNRGLTDRYDHLYLNANNENAEVSDIIDDANTAEGDTRIFDPD